MILFLTCANKFALHKIFNIITMVKFEKEFWKTKKLEDLNDSEWEALCDHCGKCCVQKFAENGKTLFTNVICDHLCLPECGCRIYKDRLATGFCVKVNLQTVREMPYLLPSTCAYKLLLNGQDLPEWHPLVTGRADSAYSAGCSLANLKVITELLAYVDPAAIEIIETV